MRTKGFLEQQHNGRLRRPKIHEVILSIGMSAGLFAAVYYEGSNSIRVVLTLGIIALTALLATIVFWFRSRNRTL